MYVYLERAVKELNKGRRVTWTDGVKTLRHLDNTIFLESLAEEDLTLGDLMNGRWIVEN